MGGKYAVSNSVKRQPKKATTKIRSNSGDLWSPFGWLAPLYIKVRYPNSHTEILTNQDSEIACLLTLGFTSYTFSHQASQLSWHTFIHTKFSAQNINCNITFLCRNIGIQAEVLYRPFLDTKQKPWELEMHLKMHSKRLFKVYFERSIHQFVCCLHKA